MDIIKWTGVGIFLAGIIVLYGSSIYPVYDSDVEEDAILPGIRTGLSLMGIGAVILIAALCVERYGEYNEMKEEISEEDLRS